MKQEVACLVFRNRPESASGKRGRVLSCTGHTTVTHTAPDVNISAVISNKFSLTWTTWATPITPVAVKVRVGLQLSLIMTSDVLFHLIILICTVGPTACGWVSGTVRHAGSLTTANSKWACLGGGTVIKSNLLLQHQVGITTDPGRLLKPSLASGMFPLKVRSLHFCCPPATLPTVTGYLTMHHRSRGVNKQCNAFSPGSHHQYNMHSCSSQPASLSLPFLPFSYPKSLYNMQARNVCFEP